MFKKIEIIYLIKLVNTNDRKKKFIWSIININNTF